MSDVSDVSESLISLTKNELIFLSESLIPSFFDKKCAIRSEIKWANSQPCKEDSYLLCLSLPNVKYSSYYCYTKLETPVPV